MKKKDEKKDKTRKKKIRWLTILESEQKYLGNNIEYIYHPDSFKSTST